ncbi:Sperm flagellar protein 2 [Phlyctochytrium bullatum]|nr:Sperm flagellar protein 2 [Phlyctochytrium bullatum]
MGPGGKKLSVAAVPKTTLPAGTTAGATGAGNADSKAAATGGASNVSLGAAVGGDTRSHLMAIIDKEHSFLEADSSIFSDFEASLVVALTVTNNHLNHVVEEPPTLEKDKKDKKKNPTAEVVEVKAVDLDSELPAEMVRTMEIEDQLLKNRLDRLKVRAYEHLKELRNKGIETYLLLDEWIGARFQAEMDAIKELLNVIKEAVELEVRLPNELVLEGEKFRVDFAILTHEPDPEPRPESPVEKQIATLDPFETGFVNWRKFLVFNAHMLPIPSVDYLVELKSVYQCCDSYTNGKISKADFLRIALWFEEEAEDSAAVALANSSAATAGHVVSNFEEQNNSGFGANPKFNRSAKLKNALFYIFAVQPADQLGRSVPTTAPSYNGTGGSRGTSQGLAAVGEEDDLRDASTANSTGKQEEDRLQTLNEDTEFLSSQGAPDDNQNSPETAPNDTGSRFWSSITGRFAQTLPADATKLDEITALLLGDNKLTAVPTNLANTFPKLVYLDLSRNNISTIPASLAELEDLEILDLSGNEALRGSSAPTGFGPVRHKVAVFIDDEATQDYNEASETQNVDANTAGVESVNKERHQLLEGVADEARRFFRHLDKLADHDELESYFRRRLAAKDPNFIKYILRRYSDEASSGDEDDDDDTEGSAIRRKELKDQMGYARKEKERYVKDGRKAGRKSKASMQSF